MAKAPNPRPRRDVKTRIVINLPLDYGGLTDELLRLADEYHWQFYDLHISHSSLPQDPAPAGAIISSDLDIKLIDQVDWMAEVPTVRMNWDDIFISARYPIVEMDYAAAGRMAAEYFHRNRFHNLLIILQHELGEASPSYQGFAERAGELGANLHIHIQRPVETWGQKKREQWKKDVGEVVASLPKPLGYFACNDRLAAQFCFDCESYGLSVPEDVAVLGLKNLEYIARTTPVPISSIDMNPFEMLRQAAALLQRLMNGEPPPASRRILVPPKDIIVRRSTDVLALPDPRAARALRYMWDHLAYPLTVEHIAEEVGVSDRTLCKWFKKYLGRGVNEELRRKRLERCRELVKSTNLGIDEIGMAVGIPSNSYLHKMFKQTYGCTPGEMRK